jgi:PAS domain S-box-containing protein
MPKNRETWDENEAVRSILEGTATDTGSAFFESLVRNMAAAMSYRDAWVTEYVADKEHLRTLAFWFKGELIPNMEYHIKDTPCEPVIRGRSFIHYPDDVQAEFPNDPDLVEIGARSYMGVPLIAPNGEILGHLAMMHDQPAPAEPRGLAIFKIFAARATAELRRMRAEAAQRNSEEQLRAVFNCALDAILTVDRGMQIVLINDAAEKFFRCKKAELRASRLDRFLSEEAADRLKTLMKELADADGSETYLWVPGGFEARCIHGSSIPAEATLSMCDLNGQPHFTVILRDVNARLDAERRIRELTEQSEYLREELRELHDFTDIIGQSAALRRTLDDVTRVATAGATVLIYGETGTGKELIARAVHAASDRSERPLIKVNCAALPAALIESELFGHERGAFTGATSRRRGRFALADGGTIFLDEIGDLPIELQAKLLRVLQEGEFEPLGSSTTVSVDVRVIAATNKDLGQAVEDGEFREDLYYRLSVFPIHVPPLREREDDVLLLADSFAQRIASRLGRRASPFTVAEKTMLSAYSWPGNVRELQNVIERAVITGSGEHLNLKRALPDADTGANRSGTGSSGDSAEPRLRTIAEIQALERESIELALQTSDWRVSGKGGAAELLGMKPTTLASRIKALGLQRPR